VDGALICAAKSGNTVPLAVPATWFFALTRDEVHSRFVRQTLIELTQWEYVSVGIPITSSVTSHRIPRRRDTTNPSGRDCIIINIIRIYYNNSRFLLFLCSDDVSGQQSRRTVRHRLLLNNRLHPSRRRVVIDSVVLIPSLYGHHWEQRRHRPRTIAMVPMSVVADGYLVVHSASFGSGRVHAAR